ncbi:MAG TPA: sterol carrier family protein [Nocardioidaceae bacterium]|nr:sterol carrier family protein [Nocardioidaceae bacterium]
MPARPRPLSPAELAAVLSRLDGGVQPPSLVDLRAAVKHFLAVLAERHPGHSVEVRVPPYAAVQCVTGVRHHRGTPPAVVETDAGTWLALARGRLDFAAAVHSGRVTASGERSDLGPLLPLT